MELRKRSINRQSSVKECQNKKQKRSQSHLSFEISQIEDLSNEIWLDLFSYFDGQSLIKSFSPLNRSIESLLSDYHLSIHFHFKSSEICLPKQFHSNQVVSLTLNYKSIHPNDFIDIRSFARLRSLSLQFPNEYQLERTSQFHFDDLSQVSIQSKCARFLTRILCIYYPNIKQMRIDSMNKQFLLKSSQFTNQISQIENLVLLGTMKFVQLFRFWSFVPNLRCFSLLNGGIHQCDYWLDENLCLNKTFPRNLSSIHLKIFDEDLSFSNFEKLIPKSIRCIKLTGLINDDDLNDYICSNNWHRLISNCSNELQSIQFNLSSHFDPNDSVGLQKILSRFRKDSLFRHLNIQSRNFHITIKGFVYKN